MTDERSSDPKLVLRAEALLAKFSTEEPDWEALATRVSARMKDPPALDEALLAAPLPEAEGESELDRLVVAKESAAGEPGTTATGAEREGVSLADLARASVARRGEREAASIAKESLAVASQSRAQGERVAERMQGGPQREPAVRAVRAGSQAPSDSKGPWIGVAIAAIGLAAGFGLYIAGQRRTPDVVMLPAPNSIVANAPVTPKSEPVAEAKASDAAKAPRAQAFDELPVGPASQSAPPSVPTAVGSPVASAAKTPAGRAFGVGVAPERVVLEEDRPASPPGAPAPARAAKPSDSALLRPAEHNPTGGGTLDRPSSGAAQAAVGAVLGAARACIAGHSAPSSATLVFGSSGQVERVSVSGPASDTPAAVCVETALKKARVQPFAAESFSLGVTVRPP